MIPGNGGEGKSFPGIACGVVTNVLLQGCKVRAFRCLGLVDWVF